MKKALLILLMSLILSNVFFINTGNSIIGDGGDSYEFLGFMHLAKENILAFKHPFAATDTLRYPNGFEFSYGYDGAFAVLTGGLLSIFTNPMLAYNLTVVLILFLNIYLSYRYFRKIGILYGNEHHLEIRSIISALVFGASPYVFARLNSHLNLAFIAGFPVFMFYLTILYHKIVHHHSHYVHSEAEIKQWDINLLLFSVILIGMGSLQYLLMLATAFPFLLILIDLKSIRNKLLLFFKLYKKEIFIGLFYFISAFLYLFGGYIAAILKQSIVFVNPYDKFFRPGILDFIIPNGYLGNLWMFLNPSEIAIERVITLGFVSVALFIFVLKKLKHKKIRILGLSLLVFYVVLGSGLLILPYLPEGGRFVILLSLFISYVFMADEKWFKKEIFYTFLVTALIVERLFFNMQVSSPVAAGVLHEKVRNLPGEAVLNVPMTKFNAYRSALPVFYNKKVLDGYFHYTAATSKSEAFFAHRLYSRFTCEGERSDPITYEYDDLDRVDFIYSLKADDIGAVVLFKDDAVGGFHHAGCRNVKDWWNWLEPATLNISKDSEGSSKKTFEIAEDNNHTIVRFFFERKGKFLLNGLYVNPKVFEGGKVKLPDGRELAIAFKEFGEGYQAEFIPPIEYQAEAGDYIYLEFPKISGVNRYIDAFYIFEMDRISLVRSQTPLQILHKGEDVEVYKVN